MSYIPMPQGMVAPIAMAGVPGAGLIPTMGGTAGVQQMQAFGLLRKARGAFVGGAVMAFSAGLLQIFASRFTFWEISNDNVDVKLSLPNNVLGCDSSQINCVTESIDQYIAPMPFTSSLPAMSKAVFACLIVSIVLAYITGAVSLVMARRVNVLLGVAAWQPYTYGTGNMAVAAWLVQRPLTVMRLALVAQIFAMLAWAMYIGPILSFSSHLSNYAPTGFTSAPGIGYILACVAAALVMMMVIMTGRAGRRLLAAEAILAAGMMGGVATVATLPGAGGFVTVAGGAMMAPGMGMGAPGGAVAVAMPQAGGGMDGYYPTNMGGGYAPPGAGYPGGGAQAVPLPPAGAYAPPTEYGKSMY